MPLVAMQQPHRGRSRAGHSHLPPNTSRRQQPCCDPVRHGSSPRTWRRRPETKQGQPSPKSYVGSPGKRWASSPLGVLGPHPSLFVSAGRQGPRPADRPQGGRARGRVPTPGCVAQRAHRAKPVCSLGVLGSFPWVFLHLLATKDGTGSKATSGSLRRPRPPDRGKGGQPRDGSSAVPTQGLGCQQATCTLKVGGKGQGPRRHKKER